MMHQFLLDCFHPFYHSSHQRFVVPFPMQLFVLILSQNWLESFLDSFCGYIDKE